MSFSRSSKLQLDFDKTRSNGISSVYVNNISEINAFQSADF